jgi:type II secretory pathway pseudopilin PulG
MPQPRRADASDRSCGPGQQDGFSIIELVITTAILMVVVAAMLSLLTTAQRTTSFANRRGESQDAVRLGLERVTKDLRQLTRFQTTFMPDPSGSWSDNTLDFYTYTPASPSQPVRVVWTIDDGGNLYRYTSFTAAGNPLPTEPVLGSITPSGAALFSTDALREDPASGRLLPEQITVSLTIDLANPGSTYSTRSQVQLRNLWIPQPPT